MLPQLQDAGQEKTVIRIHIILQWQRELQKLTIINYVTQLLILYFTEQHSWAQFYGVVTICYCCVTYNNPTGNCYHLCQTHMEAQFPTRKLHECGVLNSLLPHDLIEALICMNLLPCIKQKPSYQHLQWENTVYYERGPRIPELELAVARILWRD